MLYYANVQTVGLTKVFYSNSVRILCDHNETGYQRVSLLPFLRLIVSLLMDAFPLSNVECHCVVPVCVHS